ncbi:DoxX-like protein [Nocardia tenerifensis]|uniref:DoxX-like protein n=1 Tax=Nocardia tenerifensis TaxID=228006 RepID=A0A318K4I7_9NOCA|nr:DoxX family protein [Nocardia tenerifensis]PXX64316.1 DoxX-like protein [Nocardia tenerifensis]
MAPLVVLAVVTALARLIGRLAGPQWLDSWPHAVALGLAAMFVLTASAHFLSPRREALVAMVPPRLPNPAALVALTGVLELAGAAGLLIPATARLAAAALIAMLICLFPANIRAAKANLGVKTMPLPLRTLVQIVFIAALGVVLFG